MGRNPEDVCPGKCWPEDVLAQGCSHSPWLSRERCCSHSPSAQALLHLCSLCTAGCAPCRGAVTLPWHSQRSLSLPGTNVLPRGAAQPGSGMPVTAGQSLLALVSTQGSTQAHRPCPCQPNALSLGAPGWGWSQRGRSVGQVVWTRHGADSAGQDTAWAHGGLCTPASVWGEVSSPGRSTCKPQRTACSSRDCHGNLLLMTAAYFAMETGGKGLSLQQAALLGLGLSCSCPPDVGQSSMSPCLASSGPRTQAIATPPVRLPVRPCPGKTLPPLLGHLCPCPRTAVPALLG